MTRTEPSGLGVGHISTPSGSGSVGRCHDPSDFR
jgi:hypothetical protein